MKPCPNNRKLIAWLAVDALDARQESALRAHLETCEGCRHYLNELSLVTDKLSAVEISSDLQASESFHQKVVGRLRAEASLSIWETVMAQLRATSWRVALPVLGAAAVVALALFVWRPPVPPLPDVETASVPPVKTNLDPTISNYQMVANRSLEKLDELLTQQGSRNPSPTLIYTASTLARANALD